MDTRLPRPGRRRSGVLGAGLVVALGLSSFTAASAAAVKQEAGCATLSPGAVGPAVSTLQRAVKTTPDGDFGPMTAAAVRTWQRRHHIARTGVVDDATWAALPADVAMAACAQQVHGAGVGATCAMLAPGASGPAVAVLQKAVGTDPDGVFGPATSAALTSAQQQAKLPAASTVGPATWAALGLTGTPACTGPTPPAPKPTAPRDWKAQQVVRAAAAQLAATLVDEPGTTTNRFALKAFAFAKAQSGKPYRWGGVGPKSYDCSGLVMASYLSVGVTLPRVAADQYGAGPTVPLDRAQQGDLLFYASDVTKPATIYHVVMYAGGGTILDAPFTGAFVGSRPLWTKDLLPLAVRPVAQLSLPVRPGATGWTVTQLQQELDRHGAGLSVDGADGPATVAAVKAWKQAHGLSGSGVVWPKVWLTLGSRPHRG